MSAPSCETKHCSKCNRNVTEGCNYCACPFPLPASKPSEGAVSDTTDLLNGLQEVTFEGCGYCLIAPEDRDSVVAIIERQAERIRSLEAELEGARKDAVARSMFDRTAATMGFVNAPSWDELAEQTRQLYRDKAAERAAIAEAKS